MGGLGSKKIVEMRVESNVCVVENGRVNKDGVNGDVGEGTSRNGFDEIDKFVYNCNSDANKKKGRLDSGAGRKLPELIQGDEDNDVVQKEIDFYDVLKMLKSAVGDGDVEEVDFVETAKKRGIVFPSWPRWWYPDC